MIMIIFTKLVEFFDKLKSVVLNHKKISVVLSVIGVLIFAAILTLTYQAIKRGSADKLGSLNSGLISEIQPGIMILHSKSGSEVKTGEEIELNVVADSNGREVSGWDIVVKYNPEQVSFSSEKNLVEGYDYVRRVRKELVNLTAIQKLETNKPVVLTGTPVFELKFRALKPGLISFDILYTPNVTSQSALWDLTTRNVLSSVIGTKVEIK